MMTFKNKWAFGANNVFFDARHKPNLSLRAEITKLSNKGMTVKEIAEATGQNYHTISKQLARLGLKATRKKNL